MRRCRRCGTRTRCCAARSPGSATSPPTGSGSPCSPGWSHASAGVRCSRPPPPRYWPGTGDSSPGSGRILSAAAQDGRVVLHRGGNARQAGQDACHRAFHRSVTGTAAHHLAQFRQAGCTATGARLGEGQVRNGQRARQHGIVRPDGPDHHTVGRLGQGGSRYVRAEHHQGVLVHGKPRLLDRGPQRGRGLGDPLETLRDAQFPLPGADPVHIGGTHRSGPSQGRTCGEGPALPLSYEQAERPEVFDSGAGAGNRVVVLLKSVQQLTAISKIHRRHAEHPSRSPGTTAAALRPVTADSWAKRRSTAASGIANQVVRACRRTTCGRAPR